MARRSSTIATIELHCQMQPSPEAAAVAVPADLIALQTLAQAEMSARAGADHLCFRFLRLAWSRCPFNQFLDHHLEQFAVPLQSANALPKLCICSGGISDLRYMIIGNLLAQMTMMSSQFRSCNIGRIHHKASAPIWLLSVPVWNVSWRI